MPNDGYEDFRGSRAKPRLLTSVADWAMMMVIAGAVLVVVAQEIGSYLQAMFGAALAALGG